MSRLSIAPLQAPSLFAEVTKWGGCAPRQRPSLPDGGDNALSILGGGNGSEAATADLGADQECLCLKHRCLFSQCSILKMVGLRVSPSPQEKELLQPLLKINYSVQMELQPGASKILSGWGQCASRGPFLLVLLYPPVRSLLLRDAGSRRRSAKPVQQPPAACKSHGGVWSPMLVLHLLNFRYSFPGGHTVF